MPLTRRTSMPEPTAELRGVGVGVGLVVGSVRRMADPLPAPSAAPSTRSPDEEWTRAENAVAETADELRERALRADGTARAVLEAQALMPLDPALRAEVRARVAAGSTAESAVHDAFGVFRRTLAELGGTAAERAADVDDVARRVVARIAGVPMPGIPHGTAPFVLIARDLAPADAALLDAAVVLAIVTAEGGPTSHTAIVAREKGVPAIVGVAGALELTDGVLVAVDAARGRVLIEPDERAVATLQAQRPARVAPAAAGPGLLGDGTRVALLANVSTVADAEAAAAAGAEGVGLLRTEFLFPTADFAPSVEAQTAAYRRVLAAFPRGRVVVRVFDAGADKPVAFLGDAREPNPALGRRGIRALLQHEPVLRDQLTALARAGEGAPGRLRVMAPMVSTVDEARAFVDLAHLHGLPQAGVMIEVPSAALLADRMLAVVDFASVGSNDLTQYTMAADRQLAGFAGYQDPWHPAVLELVGRVGAAGAETGKPVGVCGEAAADPLLAVVLVGLGASSLSMAPAALADVREELARWTLDDARRAAGSALSAASAEEARSAARAALVEYPPMV